MDTILNLLTGGLGSGIIGAAGGIVTAILAGRQKAAEMAHELAMAPLRNAHELALRDADLKQVAAEAAAKVEVVREEGEANAAVAQLQALAGSYQHDTALHASASWVMRNIIDPLAAAVRPGLSIAAAIAFGYVAVKVLPVLAPELQKDPTRGWAALDRLMGSCEMVFAWWFAARLTSSRGKK